MVLVGSAKQTIGGNLLVQVAFHCKLAESSGHVFIPLET